MHRFAPILALSALACAPQSAELIEGEMVGFMSATTSFTLIKGNFDPDDVDINWNVDCRDLDADAELLSLPDPLPICNNNWPPPHENWLDLGAYRAFKMPLDVWRGEAIQLSEGDIQVGFHQRMPGGEDFRFIFSIDPVFQPTRCTGDPANPSEPLDGDWIAGWSEEINNLAEDADAPEFLRNAAQESIGGKLFFLNSFSFQWDPNSEEDSNRDIWTLPEQWRSGYGIGTFVEEDLHVRNNRFGNPSLYISFEADIGGGVPRADIFYAQCEDGDRIEDCQAWRQVRNDVRDIAGRVQTQLDRASDGNLQFKPISHGNEWRVHDSRAVGLDGWSELSYSWVMIRPDSNLEKGGNMSGFFSLVFDGDDSQSRFFVQGEFDVPRIKAERWGGRDLRAEKLEESGVEICQ